MTAQDPDLMVELKLENTALKAEVESLKARLKQKEVIADDLLATIKLRNAQLATAVEARDAVLRMSEPRDLSSDIGRAQGALGDLFLGMLKETEGVSSAKKAES